MILTVTVCYVNKQRIARRKQTAGLQRLWGSLMFCQCCRIKLL